MPMPTLFLYLFKLSIALAAVYLLYRVLLQRHTFYRANRWYLLAYPLACFAIPLIDVGPLLPAVPKATVLQWVPALPQTLTAAPAAGAGGWQWPGWVLAMGCGLLLGRLLLQYLSLRRIRRQATPLHHAGVTVYQVDKNISPFSFGNGIYVNMHKHSEKDLQEIIRHEYVHVKQRHSFDILLAELLCIVNWYNPAAWLLRHAIRQNLEFIADRTVLEGGVDKKTYQYLLLKVVGEPRFRMVNAFNFSSLKKRITMMNKIKSSKSHLLKFLFVLPLVAIMLLAFRQQIAQLGPAKAATPVTAITDTVPETNAEAPVAAPPVQPDMPKLPKNVAGIEINKKKATVTLINGATERFDLGNAKEKQAFEKKYGALPPPPPPPPVPAIAPVAPAVPAVPALAEVPTPAEAPVAPAVPAVPALAEVPTPAEAPVPAAIAQHNVAMAQHDAAMAQHNASMARHNTAMAQHNAAMAAVPKLPPHVSSLQVNNKKAKVTLKDGTVEQYNLENPKEKRAFEDRYGDLVPPPPPPPAKAAAPY
jgi:hypothetical protein